MKTSPAVTASIRSYLNDAPMLCADGIDLLGKKRRNKMSLATILLIIVILMLIGAIPTWPHSRSWGYGPSGGLGLVLIILIILLLLGVL